jgi:hypothetical protein
MPKETILKQFRLFSLGGDGIGGWLTEHTDSKVFDRLDNIQQEPLSKAQFNQLLVFGHQAPVSDDFFRYYWLESPSKHPYPVSELPGYEQQWLEHTEIISLAHLKWGLYRLFTDGLLYFGNVRTAFRTLRTLNRGELDTFFQSKRFDTEAIKQRGSVLPLRMIPQDNRYLVSEMACKSFGDGPESESEMRVALKQAYEEYLKKSQGAITFRQLLQLLTGELPEVYSHRQGEFEFAMDDILEESISSEQDFDTKFGRVAAEYFAAREAALNNTQHYLSTVSDLDVYVATSMRDRQDFRNMANFCGDVFSDERLDGLYLRYFDPTLSAAFGHEDKGLIECLMVKCARSLVYCAGKSESYGKDAEAAMALSLGKPVIFYCDEEKKSRFYRDVHPLSRLIDFETGVAVGAMVTDKREEVKTLLSRLFENKMQYRLKQHPSRKGYLMLKEQLTDSVVRLQTNDRMLSETFWNHYHNPL